MQDELCSNVSLRERSEHAGLSEEKLLELDQYSIPFNIEILLTLKTKYKLM